jgi:hypothetical protein
MLSQTNFEKVGNNDNEKMPNFGVGDTRSGLVCNGTNIWLVVTPLSCKCTAAEFRAAIKEKIGSSLDGIFLDGSGSAQLRCLHKTLEGDGRVMPAMLKLEIKTN